MTTENPTDRDKTDLIPVTRRPYRSGKSYVLAVPAAWAKRIREVSPEKDVFIVPHDNMLLVIPRTEYHKPDREVSLRAGSEDLVYSVTSYYLLGVGRINLQAPIDDETTDVVLQFLRDKLHGMDYAKKSDGKYLIEFYQPDISIPKLLESEFNVYCDMQRIVSRQLQKFPGIGEDVDLYVDRMELLEKDVDKISYQAKRAITIASSNPSMMFELGLKHAVQILSYSRIETNLERLADLQQQIFNNIMQLEEICDQYQLDLDLGLLSNLYVRAHEMANDSFRNHESKTAALIIRSKAQRSRVGQIKSAYSEYQELLNSLNKEVSKIAKVLTDKGTIEPLGKTTQSLYSLAAEIYGMIGNASNIAEAGFFISSHVYGRQHGK